MRDAMREGEHFGRIPGCGTKPTLLKPGAEKLCLTFQLAPQYAYDERQLPNGHREYLVTVTLLSRATQANVGQGVGSCSTMEAKYRYRGNAAEMTDKPVPKAYWDAKKEDAGKAQQLIGGKGFGVKKNDAGQWMITKSGGERAENPDLADTFNTVLKMAKKRALVDAVLTATAASDIFTQDLEDITANLAAASPSPVVTTIFTQTLPNAEATAVEAEVVDDGPPADFRFVRIHFGKNRGMELHELTPQQLHWYEENWKPTKQATHRISREDRTLINALNEYRQWRDAEKAPEAVAADEAVKPHPTDAELAAMPNQEW